MNATDYFDQPLAPGDEVVYMTTVRSSIRMNRGVIKEIIPLVPHWNPSIRTLIRQDQVDRADPTHFYHQCKPFILKVQVGNRVNTVHSVERVIKAPA